MTPTSIVAYLVLFGGVGFGFLFVALLAGRFFRIHAPTPQKKEIYECGEPTIGSGFVQFDLRFYVVALLFLVFDVEAAFFFPWATVYGKAARLMAPQLTKVVPTKERGAPVELSPQATQELKNLGVRRPTLPDPKANAQTNIQAIESSAQTLALTAMVDIAVFFAVLLVGFAYLWRRGDLDWVRAMTSRTQQAAGAGPPTEFPTVSAGR